MSGHGEACVSVAETLVRVEREAATLRALLREAGPHLQHREACAAWRYREAERCDCGLYALRDRIREAAP